MPFKRITVIDNCGLTTPELEKIALLSQKEISIYYDYPESANEIIRRIGDSDCLLVSWHTQITAEILRACGAGNYSGEFAKYSNIILSDQIAGFTSEAKKRLSQMVLLNLTNYLASK